MPNVFLYSGEPTPNDVRLRDPTVPAEGGGGSVALDGRIDSVAAITGTLSASAALTGTVAGLATLTGSLSVSTTLSGTVAGLSTISGSLTATTALSGTIQSQAAISGDLVTAAVLSGDTIATVRGIIGDLTAIGGGIALTGEIASICNLNGELTTQAQPEGQVDSSSEISGDLSVISETPAPATYQGSGQVPDDEYEWDLEFARQRQQMDEDDIVAVVTAFLHTR